MDTLAGLIVIDVNVALLTVSEVVADTPAKSAEIVVLPGATPVTVPGVAWPFVMLATAESDEVQITKGVRFWVLPSLNVPIA